MKTVLALSTLSLPLAAVGKIHGRFDLKTFVSEPSIHVPQIRLLNITHNRSLLQPGYIFLDTSHVQPPQVGGGSGPLIYDQEGNLVFSGAFLMGQNTWWSEFTHVCDYLGEIGTHLCYSEIEQGPSPALDGHNVQYALHRVLDSNYRLSAMDQDPIANNFEPAQRPDQHEFTSADNGKSFLRVIYNTKEVDLTRIGGEPGALVKQGCFQDVDFATREIIFQWCGIGNFQFTDSVHAVAKWVLHPEKTDPAYVWDWMHINSVDKNSEGDYLISVRYFNQVIKIAGPNAKQVHDIEPGVIMWRLGGHSGNVELGPGVEFSLQHDARFISTGESETVFSVFDNSGSDDYPFSSGKLIKINNDTMTAELIQRWDHPLGIKSDAMGSTRMQPNGNALVGWGNQAIFSEFSAEGELLYHATFIGQAETSVEKMRNYRSIKAPWVGKPTWPLKAVVYSKTCNRHDSPLVVYTSWNGATEVKYWRFSVSLLGKSGPWISAGVYAKDGFETRAILAPQLPSAFTSHARYVFVEALDKEWKPLGHTTTETFIPSNFDLDKCDDYGCYIDGGFVYDTTDSMAGTCARANSGTVMTLVEWILAAAVVVGGVFWFCRRKWNITLWRRTRRPEEEYGEIQEPLLSEKFE